MTAARNKTLKCDRGKRRQAIVQSLLADVFRGRLRAGQRLTTQELAQRFGLSHTPVREALIELAGIGVIDLHPNRGAVVRRVRGRDVREIYQVRRVLECEAVRRACGRIPSGELQALEADLKHLLDSSATNGARARYVQEARRLDSRLHDLVANCCANAFLAQELGRLTTLFRSFRDIAWEQHAPAAVVHRVAEEGREHLAIVEGLLAGDARAAARAMGRHIRSGGRYWSRAISRAAEGVQA